jgi:hypothetical protein
MEIKISPVYEDGFDSKAAMDQLPGYAPSSTVELSLGIPPISSVSTNKHGSFKAHMIIEEDKEALASLNHKLKKIKATKGHVAHMRNVKMMSGKKVRVKLRPRRKDHSSLAVVHGHYYLQTKFKVMKPRPGKSIYSVSGSRRIPA